MNQVEKEDEIFNSGKEHCAKQSELQADFQSFEIYFQKEVGFPEGETHFF